MDSITLINRLNRSNAFNFEKKIILFYYMVFWYAIRPHVSKNMAINNNNNKKAIHKHYCY